MQSSATVGLDKNIQKFDEKKEVSKTESLPDIQEVKQISGSLSPEVKRQESPASGKKETFPSITLSDSTFQSSEADPESTPSPEESKLTVSKQEQLKEELYKVLINDLALIDKLKLLAQSHADFFSDPDMVLKIPQDELDRKISDEIQKLFTKLDKSFFKYKDVETLINKIMQTKVAYNNPKKLKIPQGSYQLLGFHLLNGKLNPEQQRKLLQLLLPKTIYSALTCHVVKDRSFLSIYLPTNNDKDAEQLAKDFPLGTLKELDLEPNQFRIIFKAFVLKKDVNFWRLLAIFLKKQTHCLKISDNLDYVLTTLTEKHISPEHLAETLNELSLDGADERRIFDFVKRNNMDLLKFISGFKNAGLSKRYLNLFLQEEKLNNIDTYAGFQHNLNKNLNLLEYLIFVNDEAYLLDFFQKTSPVMLTALLNKAANNADLKEMWHTEISRGDIQKIYAPIIHKLGVKTLDFIGTHFLTVGDLERNYEKIFNITLALTFKIYEKYKDNEFIDRAFRDKLQSDCESVKIYLNSLREHGKNNEAEQIIALFPSDMRDQFSLPRREEELKAFTPDVPQNEQQVVVTSSEDSDFRNAGESTESNLEILVEINDPNEMATTPTPPSSPVTLLPQQSQSEDKRSSMQREDIEESKLTRWQEFSNWWSTVPLWKKALGVIGFTAFVAIACTGVGLALELTTMGVAATGALVFASAGSAISGGLLTGASATAVGALVSVGGALITSALAAFGLGVKPTTPPPSKPDEEIDADYVLISPNNFTSSNRRMSSDLGSSENSRNNSQDPQHVSTTPMTGLYSLPPQEGTPALTQEVERRKLNSQ